MSKNKDDTTYFLLGRIYFVEGNLQRSAQQYDSAIEINPNVKEYYYGRGLAYGFASPSLYKDAENDFKKYIELENLEFQKTRQHAYGAWAGYNDLAWIHFLQKDFDNTEKIARQGLKISTYNPWLLNMLGVALLEKHDCEEAIQKLSYAGKLTNKMNSTEFGEAYSGDDPDFWEIGKDEMQKTITENLQLCTFPQSSNSETINK